ncbi:MAG: 2-keto-3-deoxygluconate permease [Thermoguttaceae bacterium]|jgi:2-keto-3-deoxygluconate permease
MKIKQTIEKIPGGLMVVPLLLGGLLNTLDQAHLPPIQAALKAIGATAVKVADPVTGQFRATGNYEFLQIGGFTSALFKDGAFCLIGMFLVCVGAQMNFRVGARAVKKGAIVAASKIGAAVLAGLLMGIFLDPFNGILGLSMMTVIAGMSNGNGGMYAALTGQYGNRSDVGALSVISLEFGPCVTMLSLGILGQTFPLTYFIAAIVPMLLGFVLGQLDEEIGRFLRPGESLLIPFFAFALGATMDFSVFLNGQVLAGGLLLAAATLAGTALTAAVMLRLFGERSQIAAVAEASTSGNAVQTPFYVALAASAAASLAVARATAEPGNTMLAAAATAAQEMAQKYAAVRDVATAQISISTVTTALLCPIAVILYDRWQRRRGIDARREEASDSVTP